MNKNEKKHGKKNRLILALGLIISGCAPQGYEAINTLAEQVGQDISCKSVNFEENLWDGLKSFLIENQELLAADLVTKAVKKQIEVLGKNNPGFNKTQKNTLNSQFSELIETILREAPEGERVTTAGELLILISAIDVGDRSTTFRSYLQDKVRKQFSAINVTAKSLSLSCSGPDKGVPPVEEVEVPSQTPAPGEDQAKRDFTFHKNEALKNGVNLAAFGARWTLATAYQTCQSTQIPDMNAQTKELEGIKITGTHSDGVGSKRMIASLGDVQSSHPYLKGVSSHAAGCFNVHSNPLIYDYGGKPYGTTEASSPIDLFKDSGSGTSVLGIDCSGYVYTSMAAAGLRLKSGRALKASDSWAWGSGSYVEPAKNGLTCLDKVTVTPNSSLRQGDIIAVYGHVVIVESAGADPFGISKARNLADCSKLSTANYDFTVAQSSPSKNGVGINFFEAHTYVPTSSKIETGLQQYAYYSCLAKFDNKSYTPNVGTLTVSRHNGTSACLAPRVQLAQESCISQCSSFIR